MSKEKLTLLGGTIYEGEVVNGKPHGKGKKTEPSGIGVVEEGDWESDELHGKGKLSYKDGTVYEGDFVHGRPNGKGTITYADGRIYEGDASWRSLSRWHRRNAELSKSRRMVPQSCGTG